MLLNQPTRLFLTAIAAASLAACGGGGDSSSSSSASAPAPAPASSSTPAPAPAPASAPAPAPAPTPAPAPASVTLSGVAATGAPLSGATVKVFDGSGTQVATKTTETDGSYSVTLPSTATAPFVLVAEHPEHEPLVSTVAEATTTTANITPLTHVIASRLSSSGDPTKLADEVKAGTVKVDKAALQTRTQEIMTAIAPLLTAAGQTGTVDPITTRFAADGTGLDKVLDSLSVAVKPTSSGANIEIAVRERAATEGQQPNAIRFGHSEAPQQLAAVQATNLVADGTSVLLSDMVTRLNACYALPVDQRVRTGGTTAADIVADACKSLFFDDSPATYKQNGAVVASTGAFSGLYRTGATGAVFSRPVFEFSRQNGDLVFTVRWVDVAGNTDTEVLIARKQNDKLKLIGNQYKYEASVKPSVQLRTFLNQSASSYLSTGYDIYVGNKTDGNGAPLFSKVVVTTPRGNLLTLKPSGSLSYLVLTRADGTPTATSQVRLAAKYLASSTTGNPSEKETSLFFANPQMSDTDLAALGHQGNWKFEYYLAANTTTTPDEVEHRRTLTRAPTLGEASQIVWPTFTEAFRNDLVAKTNANGVIPFATAAQVTGLAWEIPTGAWLPTSSSVFGRAPSVGTTLGARFNDSVGYRSSVRAATIACSRQNAGDTHCDATTPTNFAVGSNINSINLAGNTPRNMTLQHMYALYKL